MREQWTALVFGWVFIFIFLFIVSILLTLVLTFLDISPNVFTWVAFSFAMIGLFTGGVISGLKGKKRGWFFGGIVGVGFSLLIFLIQFLGYQSGFSLEQTMQHAAYIVAAIFGGIVGVNIMQAKE